VIPGLLIAMASVKDVPAPADNPDTGVAHQAEPSAGPASPPAPVPALRATTT
jgi:hypothetical protein